ncbi:MAG: 2-phospho-L-lactate transferase [Chloroflexi bacterium]|nr:MAG: 2-phospho-L-lactate transferase [Chloroflexota bacterium]TMF38899.1 MAG: 2-phospho-L-lactate transferase [Chloroflexota bacterium]
MKVVVLAGGTGGAALAAGIQSVAPEHELTVIANTADDDEFWGLLVCPDVDAVIYRLAGVFNERAGYGVKDDTFHVLESMDRIGEDAWFRIGDQDLASHLVRAGMLRAGCTLTEATRELCRRFGVAVQVLPMTDDRVRTRFATDKGELSFQEYFVRERLAPRLSGIDFAGLDSARPTPEVLETLREAGLVIIGPSNPLISIAPILTLVRDKLSRERTVAVTPIVEGVALKGPTVEMMRTLGPAPNPVEVARMYGDIAGAFVLDSRDRDLADSVERLGHRVIVCDTIMRDGGRALAQAVLSAT